MFGAATTLVAESVPGRVRSVALGALQALSALGNIIGSLISLNVQPGAHDLLWGYSGWRVLFFVGILPALLVVPIVLFLREPEAWRRAKAEAGAQRAARRRRFDRGAVSPSALAPPQHHRPARSASPG